MLYFQVDSDLADEDIQEAFTIFDNVSVYLIFQKHGYMYIFTNREYQVNSIAINYYIILI